MGIASVVESDEPRWLHAAGACNEDDDRRLPLRQALKETQLGIADSVAHTLCDLVWHIGEKTCAALRFS